LLAPSNVSIEENVMGFSFKKSLKCFFAPAVRRPYQRGQLILEVLESRLVLAPATGAAIYTVTIPGDNGPPKGAHNGIADPNNPNGGDLRYVIELANGNKNGSSTINFDLPFGSRTIILEQVLTLTRPMTINGYSQGAGKLGAKANTKNQGDDAKLLIVLDGNRDNKSKPGGGATSTGLDVRSSNVTIEGLVIDNFSTAIQVDRGSQNVKIAGNFIGINQSGTAAPKPNVTGIFLFDGTSGDIIGGTNPADRNIISGNTGGGIAIETREGTPTSDIRIYGNYIGTDRSGDNPVKNGDGISIFNSPENVIGGTAPGAGNVISGSTKNGIHIWGEGSILNIVRQNNIGTNAGGNAKVPNDTGVFIDNAPRNKIGTGEPSSRNIRACQEIAFTLDSPAA
jgi:hypothetical protein